MLARMKKVSATFTLVLLIAAVGVVSGSVFQETVAPDPVAAYCEEDICVDFDGECHHSGVMQTNCDQLFSGGCDEIGCQIAGGGGPEREQQ